MTTLQLLPIAVWLLCGLGACIMVSGVVARPVVAFFGLSADEHAEIWFTGSLVLFVLVNTAHLLGF